MLIRLCKSPYKVYSYLLVIILLLNCTGCCKLLDQTIVIYKNVTNYLFPGMRTKISSLVIENRSNNGIEIVLSKKVSIPGYFRSFTIPSCSRFQASVVIVPIIEREALYSITTDISDLTVSEKRSPLSEDLLDTDSELILVEIDQKEGHHTCRFTEPQFTLMLENYNWGLSINVNNIYETGSLLFLKEGGSLPIGVIQGYIAEAYRYQATWHEANTLTVDSCVCSYLSDDPITTSLDEAPSLSLIFHQCFGPLCSNRNTN
jgi:hypothetical protein